MKLSTHVLYELLNLTISIVFGPTNRKSILKKPKNPTFGTGYFFHALRYQPDFWLVCMFCWYAEQWEIFFISDDVNWPNQPTSQKPIKMDNFYKNCPIWLKFGMQVFLPYITLRNSDEVCPLVQTSTTLSFFIKLG